MENELKQIEDILEQSADESVDLPSILEEITVEEMAVDGICGIY